MSENLSKKELYDQQKAERLAAKEKELKAAQKKQDKANKTYNNPVNSVAGKILVFTLCGAMLFGIIFGLIMSLINAF